MTWVLNCTYWAQGLRGSGDQDSGSDIYNWSYMFGCVGVQGHMCVFFCVLGVGVCV